MPIYEGIGSDKNSVVIEIGTYFTKCGFASELSPRAIIRSQVYLSSVQQDVDLHDIQDETLLTVAIKEFLQLLYFKYLAVNPKDRRVVVVEPVFCSTSFRNRMAEVLYKHLDVPSILFVPHHMVVLSTLGISTGLVLDVGYKEATAIPIVDGATILDSIQFAPLGGKSIHYRIMDELIQRKAIIKENNQELPVVKTFEESVLEEIKVKTCFVTNMQRGAWLAEQKLEQNKEHQPDVSAQSFKPVPSVRFPLRENQILKIPGSLRESVCEVLFEMYGEEHTLPTLIIEAIMSCSIDCRRQLASNIVLIGGTVMLAGFKHRLFQELQHLASNSQRYKQLPFAKNFKLHKLPCKENYASWLGASIFATSDLLSMRSFSKDQYTDRVITDWATCWNPGI